MTNEAAVADAGARVGAPSRCPTRTSRARAPRRAIGVARAMADGFERALLVPGDCPALDPTELDGLLGERARPAQVS